MDSIVHSALEEICSRQANGLLLRELWPKLHSSLTSNGLPLCNNVKKALWANIISIPNLQFESRRVSDASGDSRIQDVVVAEEEMELKIVASEDLRNSFLGMYDIKASDSGVSEPQRRTLERLAVARTKGVTQNELAKEFGMKNNNIFYVLRNLECRGLIVRQSTVVRKKEACNEGGPKNNLIVATNMLYLYRYAKHLGNLQRLEITKEDNAEESAVTGDGISEECIKEDVQIKDFVPALRAICDKLEKADSKVLVVSDIKKDLGYTGNSGHRAWRNIRHKLKDAGLVEEFFAKVNEKEVNCLRLLKKFSPEKCAQKVNVSGENDLDTQEDKPAKRGQTTDQLVELPIEQQIYDMIEAAGSKGLITNEIYKRLGISNKRYHLLLLDMISRFQMHLNAEKLNRGVAYRVWTYGNFNPQAADILPNKTDDVVNEKSSHVAQLNSAQDIQEVDHWTSNDDTEARGGKEIVALESSFAHGLAPADSNAMLLDSKNMQNESRKPSGIAPDAELEFESTRAVSDVVEMSPVALPSRRRRRSYMKYPCLSVNSLSSQREQKILEMLQEQKFLIRPELHRHLENLDEQKQTLDRKTLNRSLNKLQQEGHCRCISVSVPVVTNCGRKRTVEVILHPSVVPLSDDLSYIIHERLRSFEKQIRVQSYYHSKKDKSVPVLDSIERVHKTVDLDAPTERSETMHNKKLAKMVRTRLLHIFLWGYLNSLPGWDDAISASKNGYDEKNPHTTSKFFELDAAIKAMPLELFLQVARSSKKFEDITEKCRRGLCLSDLSVQEYKCLMDTGSTGRLSNIIDVLRRLKLLRLSSGQLLGSNEFPHATLRHSIELKPYIEEPVARVFASSSFNSLDLRPHIRHDFVLSSRKAVDEYWNTLEYCYAAADSEAALHAFPGSAVHEIFHPRSWTSERVMTADQRSKVLKCLINDPNKSFSFLECEKIADDLNLTMEQVLRVYHAKQRKRLNRLEGPLNAKREEIQTLKRKDQKRKRSEIEPVKQRKVAIQKSLKNLDVRDEETDELMQVNLYEATEITKENSSISSVEHETDILHNDVDSRVEGLEELELDVDDDGDDTTLRECALSMASSRQRKFTWSENADRQMVVEYVRHRAALGASYHRVDWASLPNLPASPAACRRRMANLKSNRKFRKAVMSLCTLLSERYAKCLQKFQSSSHGDSCRIMIRNSLCQEGTNGSLSNSVDDTNKLDEEPWDNFADENIKKALDEVLQHKRTYKPEAAHGFGSFTMCPVPRMVADGHDHHETSLVSLANAKKGIQNTSGMRESSSRSSGFHLLPRKYISCLDGGKGADRQAYNTLAVSNAAELFKLVFLSTARGPEVPNLLAETLRHYSEHDLFAAFNYLKDRKIMVGGNGSSPFALSEQFLQNISSSPFPMNTGKRAVKMVGWLREREKDFLEDGIDLFADMQCGDVFHLCALLSSGEVSISPCLPEVGVGEADGPKKRKYENKEICSDDKAKKLKVVFSGEGEVISRREKGFPGIQLTISRAVISRVDAITLFGKDNTLSTPATWSGGDPLYTSPGMNGPHISSPFHMEGSGSAKTVAASKSSWEAMTCYAAHLVSSSREEESPFYPELFRSIHSAIHKAGDQGLTIAEISHLTNVEGGNVLEVIIEVLEAFGRVLKVNAYDSVHVVDSLYRSKYFLTSAVGHSQEDLSKKSQGLGDDEPLILQGANCEDYVTNLTNESYMNADEVHKVTILNHPKDVEPLNETQKFSEIKSYKKAEVISPGIDREVKQSMIHLGDSPSYKPILPWINGDGTINDVVYKGLVRRVLGIVMQNPGILEDYVIQQMHVLNPQSCRKLLELMILDNHIMVRKMYQSSSGAPPSILGRLLGSSFKKPKFVFREHLFANPMSTSCL